MTGTIDPKVLERIQKLHRMAEGAKEVGSLAEAEAFMEGVEKTLAAHNLDMSVVDLDLRNLTDPLITEVAYPGETRKSRPEEWSRALASAVADAHFCDNLIARKSNAVFFCGRKNNVETAKKMYRYLTDMAIRLGTAAYLAEEQRLHRIRGTARGAAQFKWNWFEGFAAEVSARYKAMRVRVESDNGMAVIFTGIRKEAQEFAHGSFYKKYRCTANPKKHKFKSLKEMTTCPKCDAPLEQEYEDDNAKESDYFNQKAYTAGAEAARSVSLRPHDLNEGNSGSTKRLGGGE